MTAKDLYALAKEHHVEDVELKVCGGDSCVATFISSPTEDAVLLQDSQKSMQSATNDLDLHENLIINLK